MREVVLTRRPSGRPTADCFDVIDRPVPGLTAGCLLMRAAAISVDPSMIPRLTVATYAPAFQLDTAIEARAVGQVARSAADGWEEGDWALFPGGWRDLAVVEAGSALRIHPSDALPPHMWLHAFGVPGLTAYIGLLKVAQVRARRDRLGLGRRGCCGFRRRTAGQGTRRGAGDRIDRGYR